MRGLLDSTMQGNERLLAEPGRVFYAILDTKGAGRLVGIFDDRERAEKIAAIDPAYFRLIGSELNAINPVAITWLLTEPQRASLRSA